MFLRALLDAAIADPQLNIDPLRIHVVGRSNGGFMAYRLACEHADLVASIIVICGGFYKEFKAEEGRCRPSAPVSVLHVHGTRDHLIPYACYAEQATADWALKVNGCSPAAVSWSEHARAPTSHAWGSRSGAAIVQRYAECPGGAEVELWTAPNVHHCPSRAWINLDWLLAHPKSAAPMEWPSTASDMHSAGRPRWMCAPSGKLGCSPASAELARRAEAPLPAFALGLIVAGGLVLLVAAASLARQAGRSPPASR